jgi:hypothetical protein
MLRGTMSNIVHWRKIMRRQHIARMLLGIAAGLLIAGFTKPNDTRPRNRIPLPIRMLSSALVLVAAVILAGSGKRTAQLAAGGMAWGFLGDLLMAKLIPVPDHVLAGMASFGIGHGLYIAACNQVGRQSTLTDRRTGVLGLLSGWLMAVVGWRVLAYSPARGSLINSAALGYALLLGSMSGLAGSLASQDRRCVSLALGGNLFLLSDLILAGEIFRNTHFPSSGDLIWLTYWAGQALIVDSLGGALAEL